MRAPRTACSPKGLPKRAHGIGEEAKQRRRAKTLAASKRSRAEQEEAALRIVEGRRTTAAGADQAGRREEDRCSKNSGSDDADATRQSAAKDQGPSRAAEENTGRRDYGAGLRIWLQGDASSTSGLPRGLPPELTLMRRTSVGAGALCLVERRRRRTLASASARRA